MAAVAGQPTWITKETRGALEAIVGGKSLGDKSLGAKATSNLRPPRKTRRKKAEDKVAVGNSTYHYKSPRETTKGSDGDKSLGEKAAAAKDAEPSSRISTPLIERHLHCQSYLDKNDKSQTPGKETRPEDQSSLQAANNQESR